MIGLFFGSFNPFHNGHFNIARYLLDKNDCSEIWFIVSPRNPLKTDRSLLDEEKRFEMVQLGIAADPRMKACDIEFAMPKPSYTIDTLRKITSIYTDKKFALIIGGDNLRNFHLWKNYLEIVARYPILVYPRPGITLPQNCYPHVTIVNAPQMTVSSTEIRRMVRDGEDISSYVPEEILPLVYACYVNFRDNVS